MTKPITGVVSFLLTPTAADGSIDGARLCSLADEQIAAGVDGLTLFGSTGAIGSFAEDERRMAAEVLVRHVAGRVPVMVGTGAITTAEAVRLSRHAEQVGADAVLVVPITYWLLNDEELLTHYRAIAGSVRLPLMLYNNPRLSGVDIQPHVVAQLVETPNIFGIKEASPDLLRVSILAQMLPGRLRIFAGRDAAAFEMLMIGAEGWTSGLANITPRHCVELFRLVRAGDIDAARALWYRLAPIATFTRDKGLVRASHTAFEIMGRSVGKPRPPIGMLSRDDAKKLETLMTELGEVKAAPRKVAAE